MLYFPWLYVCHKLYYDWKKRIATAKSASEFKRVNESLGWSVDDRNVWNEDSNSF